MGLVKVWPGGSSASFPASSNHKRARRGVINGWTPAATRGLTQFLWSVDPLRLDGRGFAVTCTTGGRPASSVDWAAARNAWLERQRRRGVVRFQWLTEWTSAGRPHMHACLYGDQLRDWELATDWIDIASRHGWDTEWRAQHVEPVFDVSGWLKYVAKHSARGVDHYQRESPPPGWETTGRLWGRSRGDSWPTAEPFRAHLANDQTWSYIGQLVSWQAARMRREGVADSVISAWLDSLDTPEMGAVPKGISGWIPWDDSLGLLMNATEFNGQGESNVSSNEGHRPGDGDRHEQPRRSLS
jgi:hypothetical protein